MPEVSPEYIKSLVRQGESDQVEFKARFPPQSILSGTIAAFANTKGGTVFIGIDDREGIVGVPQEHVKPQLEKLSSIASALTINVSGLGVENVDGKNVLWVSVLPVPSQNSPVMTSRGELLMRQGTSNVKAEMSEEMRLAESIDMKIAASADKLRLFVAMSFREEEEPALVDYYNAMKRAVNSIKLPIDVKRVDLVEGDFEISQRIMDELDMAEIVLVDFTLNPQNVYFEVGYARGKGKRILQTARKGTELSFDVRNWKTIFYRNATELEEKLKEPIITAFNERRKTS